MTMCQLRNMTRDDLPAVNSILSKAFSHARMQNGYTDHHIPLCKLEFLEMYRSATPEGAYVLEKQGKIIAYSFCRLWGRLGWIGPLSVLPEEQGYGYGKTIVQACVEFLKSQGARTIGLEMPARSVKNLGFYIGLNFVPQNVSVDLFREINKKPLTSSKLRVWHFLKCNSHEKQEFLDFVKKLNHQLDPYLTYTGEIVNTVRFHFGDGLLFMKKQLPLALVIAHTETYSSEEKRQFLKITALQMAPDCPMNLLDEVLGYLEHWALQEKLFRLYIRIPARYFKALKYFLSKNFKVINTDLRMTLRGFPQRDSKKFINLNKWV